MNILQKLTKKDLKLNKKRTIGTLIGIILSTALITAVGGMAVTLRKTLIEGEISNKGYYHIQLSDVSEEETNKIKLNEDYNHYEIVNDLGIGIFEGREYEYEMHIYSMSKETGEYLKKKVIKGEFPKNETEILIPKTIATEQKYKIGDEITQKIENKEYKFKISGLTNEFNSMITSNIKSDKIDIYLTLKKPRNYKTDFKELLGNDSENPKYEYSINKSLLNWEVGSFSDSSLKVIATMVAISLIIILITSVFSIRNSFAISTTEKLKTYGMLSSIGATKKQIKKMVLYEGRKLGLIGITLGSALGTLVTYLLTVIINYIAIKGELLQEGWMLVYQFSIIPIILAIILGTIIIFLSTVTCAIKASKVTPIQNIKNADNIKNKKIDLKTPNWVKKIFKIGGVLSYKNLKRSKRKYRVTIVSLTVSIFVFITISSFVECTLKIIKTQYINVSYNIEVEPKRDIKYEMIEKIDTKKITSLDESYIIYMFENKNLEGFITKDTSRIKYKNIIAPYCIEYEDPTGECRNEVQGTHTMLYILDKETFKKYAKTINANYEDIKDKAILINTQQVQEEKKIVYKELTNYKVNEEIKIESIMTPKTLTYKIGAITDEKTFGLETQYTESIILVLNQEFINEKTEVEKILINAKKPNEVEQKLKEMENIHTYNLATEVKAMKTMILILSIFVYGFIIVVTLIGITSVFNTITSNIQLRQKDFATLKSIGMTKKEFNKMITLESLFYSFKSLFIGIILGLIGSYLVYKLLSTGIEYKYTLPYNSIIISILFITIIVFIIMKYSISKVNKQNIIETIRKDNI